MKRILVSLLLIITLLIGISAEAEDRFTISDIYEQYNGAIQWLALAGGL